MRISVIVGSADLNWIGGRLAMELVARLSAYDIQATVNGQSCDMQYQQIVYGPPTFRPAVGMFTHGEHRPKQFGREYDGQIALNPEMRRYLVNAGCPHSTVIDLPVDAQYIKHPVVFGVAGRTYADGRKGEHLVRAAVEAGYKIIGWGSGWPCEIVSSRLEDLPAFYRSLDYYIDTSSDEGGCVPALECLALGVPVISHTLGVDRPVIPYERHDWHSLEEVLFRLTHPHTYDDWARRHALYFQAVYNRNWNEFWERSA